VRAPSRAWFVLSRLPSVGLLMVVAMQRCGSRQALALSEGYHPEAKYGTTRANSGPRQASRQNGRKIAALPEATCFWQGKRTPAQRGFRNETKGPSQHPGLLPEADADTCAGRSCPQAEAALPSSGARREAARDLQEVGPERRMRGAPASSSCSWRVHS